MRRRVGSENRDPGEILPIVDGFQRRPEGATVAVGVGEIGDVGGFALPTADDAAILVVNVDARKPVAGVDDDVIEIIDLSRPRMVVLVEVDFEKIGSICGFEFSLIGSDEVWGPKVGHGEIVIYIFPMLEMFIGCWGNVDRVLHLKVSRLIPPCMF